MIRRDFIHLTTRLLEVWQLQEAQGRLQQPLLAHMIESHLREIKACEYRLHLARRHGWHLAAAELQAMALLNYRRLRILLQDREDDARLDPPRQIGWRDLYSDLMQLQEEFAQVTINWQEGILAVHTDPIVLHGIALGPFAIQFRWRLWPKHEEVSCWTIVALEAHASNVNPAVTHPHVSGEELCAGDAAIPMMKALREGRLAEALLLIRAVLSQYNSGSAYVRLEEWSGIGCHDCGNAVTEDIWTHCDGCNHYFCSNCAGSCSCCDIARCLGCLSSCARCEEACCSGCQVTSSVSDKSYCRHCLEECAICGERMAPDEIDEESGLCSHCQESDQSAEQLESAEEVAVVEADDGDEVLHPESLPHCHELQACTIPDVSG